MDTLVISLGDFKVMFILKGYYRQYPLGHWVKFTVRKGCYCNTFGRACDIHHPSSVFWILDHRNFWTKTS